MLLNHLNHIVLIAEDDNMSFRYLEVVLSKKTNLKIIRAKDGAEAVILAKENPDISLILMDIQLPIMTGYEAVLEIRTLSTRLVGKISNLMLFVKGSNVGITELLREVFTYLSPIPRTVIKPPLLVATPETRCTAPTT